MIILEIHHEPVAQKQTRFVARGKHFFGIDPSKNDKLMIQWQIRPFAPKNPLEGPLSIDLMFHMPIPKSESKARKAQMINGKILPIKRPDLDNMGYFITNAMKEIIYEDDSQIVDLNMHKRYHEQPKIIVKISQICE